MPADPVATRRLIESLSTHLEDHLATWKSSLVDARRDIEALLAALSEKIPAQAKPLFPEDVVSMMLEDIAPPPPPPPPPPPEPKIIERVVEKIVAGPATPPDWTLVRGAVSSIESARTQVDVLTRFISQAAAHASRTALLVLRNDRITGWKSTGFDASGGRDEAVRAIDLGAEEDAFAAEVLRVQRSRLAEPPDEASPLRKALGGRAPARILLVPMVIRDRLAGLVYADELPGEEGRLNEGAIEVLSFVTGLAVDLLAARKKIPSPTLTPTGESIERFRPAAGEAPAAKPVPAPVFEPDRARPAPAEAPAAAPHPHPTEPALATSGIRPRPKPAEEQLRDLAESAGLGRRPSPPPPPDAGVTVAVPVVAPPSPPAPTPPPAPAPEIVETHPAPAPRPPSFESAPAAPAVTSSPALAIPVPLPPPVPTRPPSSFPPPLSQTTTGDFTEAFDALRSSGAAAPPTSPGVPIVPLVPRAAPPPPAMTPPPTIPAVGARPPAAPGTTEVRPISGFIPRSRLGASAADSPQRQREDARRLARLLVSEIKLYNEKKVDEGRAANDLYARLKDDIDRSRQVFEERIPEPIRRETDFFREELVRILADGRAEALGSTG